MKLLKYVALSGFGLLMLSSCSEDQSSFDIQKIPGRCFIEGVVKYNEGTTIENGKFSYTYQPAANLELTFVVQNGSYGNLSGTSTFKTTTDAEGKYSIEIPAPLQNATVNIYTEDFKGVRTYITTENNQIVTKNEEVIYRGISSTSIHSEGIVYANFLCNPCSVNSPVEGFSQFATIKGKVGQGVEYKVDAQRLYDNANNFVGYSNAAAYYVFDGAKVDMIVDVDYEGQTFTYNVTSSAAGEWSLQVPVAQFPASFTYTLTAVPYDANYTHYVPVDKPYTLTDRYGVEREYSYIDYEAVSLKGFYSQKFNVNFSAAFPVAAQVCDSEAKLMVFQPLNNGQDTYNYNPNVYSQSNLWRSELIEQLAQ